MERDFLSNATRRDFVAACLGTPAVAGCLSGNESDESSTEDDELSIDDATIELWHQETQLERREKMRDLASQFEREYGPDVTIEAIPTQEVLTEFQLTDIDEMFTIAQFNTPQLDFVRGRDQLAMETARKVVDDIGPDSFWDTMLEFAETEDGYFGVPFFVWVQGPFYRQSAFESHGIEMTPRSWDDLLDAAQQLHKPDEQQYGIIIGEDAETEYPTHCYTQLALSNDTPLFSPSGEILFDTDPHIETLEFYRQLAEYTPPGTVGPQVAFDSLVEGRCHLGLISSHLLTYLWNNAEDRESAVADFRFSGYLKESRRSSYGFMNYLVFDEGASETELAAAREFATFLLFADDHENYVDWLSVQFGGFQPVFEGFHDNQSYQNIDVFEHVDESITQEIIPNSIREIERFGGTLHDEYFPIIGEIEGQYMISDAIHRIIEGENARRVAEETATEMRNLRE